MMMALATVRSAVIPGFTADVAAVFAAGRSGKQAQAEANA